MLSILPNELMRFFFFWGCFWIKFILRLFYWLESSCDIPLLSFVPLLTRLRKGPGPKLILYLIRLIQALRNGGALSSLGTLRGVPLPLPGRKSNGPSIRGDLKWKKKGNLSKTDQLYPNRGVRIAGLLGGECSVLYRGNVESQIQYRDSARVDVYRCCRGWKERKSCI